MKKYVRKFGINYFDDFERLQPIVFHIPCFKILFLWNSIKLKGQKKTKSHCPSNVYNIELWLATNKSMSRNVDGGWHAYHRITSAIDISIIRMCYSVESTGNQYLSKNLNLHWYSHMRVAECTIKYAHN
jgi:hypothetical protein